MLTELSGSTNIAVAMIALATAGIIDTVYIEYVIKSHKRLTCGIKNHNCNAVVTSKYNTAFGIKNTYLGIVFYILVITRMICEILMRTDVVEFTGPIGIAMTTQILPVGIQIIATVAVLMSLYLIYIQKYKLKTFCLYCLFTAAVNISILTLVILYYN